MADKIDVVIMCESCDGMSYSVPDYND